MGGSAPKPDKAIGKAAELQAKVGQNALDFMKDQSKITNAWANIDRNRQQSVFVPLQNEFIAEAQSYSSPERQASEAGIARADVQREAGMAAGQVRRQQAAVGATPGSGRAAALDSQISTNTALGSAGAGNMARRGVMDQGRALRASAINLGSGLAVNPGTSVGLSNGAASSGFGQAQQGFAGQANTLNNQHQSRMQAWQGNQNMLATIGGGVGGLIGMFSDENMKKDRKAVPEGAGIAAVRDMPVDEWTYKEGMADGGQHVGPMAQDFQRATGKGDGKVIPIIDYMGTLTKGLQDVDANMMRLEAKIDGMNAPGPALPPTAARGPAPRMVA